MNYQFHLSTPTILQFVPQPMETLVSFTDTPPTSNNFEEQYTHRRLIEWLTTAQKILHDYLQPGFYKTTKRMPLGSIETCHFIRFMRQFIGLGKMRESKRSTYVDMERVKSKCYSFKFTVIDGLPPLLNNDWHSRNMQKQYRNSSGEIIEDHMKSVYTKITFTINESTNLVDCSFSTQSLRLINNKWIPCF